MVTRGSRNHLSGINLSPLYRRSFKQLHPPRIATLLCRRRIDLAPDTPTRRLGEKANTSRPGSPVNVAIGVYGF